MKELFFFFAWSFLVCSPVFTQSSNDYKAGQDGWLVNLEEAYNLSKKSGKPIMANFTGSDWCGWCKRLAAAVFDQPEFKKWADKNVVLLELDFPRRKEVPMDIKQQNASLQRAFQVRGYPTVWIFEIDRPAGSSEFTVNPLGKTGYKPSVEEFTSDVDRMLKNGNSLK